MKTCIDCGRQYMPKSNRQKRCVECGKAYDKAYNKAYELTPKRKAYKQTPKRKSYQKTYELTPKRKAYKQSPEYKDRQKDYQKKYRKAYELTPKRKAYKKAYKKTPEYKVYEKTYRQTPKRRAYEIIQNQKRRVMKKLLPNTFSVTDWQHALTYFQHTCAYCGKFSQALHQEHVVPLTKGGGYTPDNIVPACPRCNSRKHTKTAQEFLQEINHIEMYPRIVSYLQARA